VGTSGATLERLAPVVASARSRPAFTNETVEATLATSTCVSPASMPAIAGPAPL
jgi:hypothetical protein